MERHGDLFPEHPENVDELIDALARRQAAADRLMASLSPEQREQLGQLMSDAMSDPDLASADGPALRQPAGAAAGVGTRTRSRPTAPSRSATATPSSPWRSWPTWRRSSRRSPRATRAPASTTSTWTRWRSGSARAAAADFRALRELEHELERQGYVVRGDDGLRLTPRAVRRLGESALRRVFAQIDAAGSGDHEDHRTGSADEPRRVVEAVGLR